MTTKNNAAHGTKTGAALRVNQQCNLNASLCLAQSAFTSKGDCIAAFRDAMHGIGLQTDAPIITDGKLHRVHVEAEKRGSKNGWYVLHGDALPAGAFGNWKTGESHTWCAKPDRTLTPTERARISNVMPTRSASAKNSSSGNTNGRATRQRRYGSLRRLALRIPISPEKASARMASSSIEAAW